MNDHDVLRRAALAVVRAADHEGTFYEAQSLVEDWALDALSAAVTCDLDDAELLLNRYEHADWEVRRAHAYVDWTDQCLAAARAANVP